MTKNKIKNKVALNLAPVMFIEEVTDDEELKSVYGGETPPDSVLNTKIIAALENRGIPIYNDPNNPSTLTEEVVSAFKGVSGNET
ncbi:MULTISPECIES: hypothetical protein [unclassified Nostoc]|uniref:hypothetical protein n=1 Tax=unclassified Nostoc TaxID=2593658 RepID=UPI0025AA5F6E|nr:MULTISPECIES: hypothetical protein [unclassified Nostoc]MDM9584641.1 hypothetical protein [Nostoc sp. GT001]MDZ7944754.1 hypothetical protein [Nostoc sp. EfeVER01]MDZ7996230.1 hypothetical protein [Nostoc sp. EspVER01]